MARVKVGDTFVSMMDGADHAKFELLLYKLLRQLRLARPYGLGFGDYVCPIRFQLTTDREENFSLIFTFPESTDLNNMFALHPSELGDEKATYITQTKADAIDGFSMENFGKMLAMRIAQHLAFWGHILITKDRDLRHEDRIHGYKSWVWQFVHVERLEPDQEVYQ